MVTHQAARVGCDYFCHADDPCLRICQRPILGPPHFKVKRQRYVTLLGTLLKYSDKYTHSQPFNLSTKETHCPKVTKQCAWHWQ